MQLGEDTIEATAATAAMLAVRTGLPPVGAAIVAVLDAIEQDRWPVAPLAELVAVAYELEREAVADQLGELARSGLLVRADGGVQLDPIVKRALATEPPELEGEGIVGVWAAGSATDAGDLATQLATVGSLTVVSGDTIARRLEAIHAAVVGELAVVKVAGDGTGSALIDAVRIAWLRGAAIAVFGGELEWIDRVVRIGARIAIAVDARDAGHALARCRRVRPTVAWPIRAVKTAAPTPIDRVLEPLIATTWNGARIGGSQYRLAALAGSDAAIDAAARAVAAGLHTTLVTASARSATALAAIREAIVDRRVVLLDAAAELDPIAARALVAMLAPSDGLVLVAAHSVPPGVDVELTLQLGDA